ncbi:MAG: MBL fold metallo-hydrolase [Candidatus Lokiarchaeota archaeon]|nr:MBL fold metallo-hydrolase [Candidatus Lokiarchaeota archaeon]
MESFIRPLSEEFKSIYFIEGERNARYPYSHSMIFGDYLIDTGISPKRLRKVIKSFQINHVLLSHWHEDHISGNYLIKNKRFYCHEKDKPIIEDISKMNLYYNTENTPVGEELKNLLDVLRMQNTFVDYTIENDQTFQISADLDLQVIHTPGHTAGHCGFYEKNSKICFFGDIDLTKYPYYGSIDASLIEFEHSIEILENLDIEIAVTGHKNPIIGKSEIKEEFERYKLILKQRDERILMRFREFDKPINSIDLQGQNLIYTKYTIFKNFELISEILMLNKHFEKLEKAGQIIKEKNGFILN